MDNKILGNAGPNGVVEDSFQAFLVDGAEFTSREQYPKLRADMIPQIVPKKIMPFEKAIHYQGDLSDTYICMFCPDRTFERVRRNPRRYVAFFRRTAGIIGFDYSVHTDMPLIKQKQQINDNLSLTYYYGNQMIHAIPNLRCGVDELLPEFLEAIPKHSIIAIGTHGFCKTISEKCEWRCFLETVIETLEPSTIVVYGSLQGKMFDELKERVRFVFYEPWIGSRYKEVKQSGNKRR